jgi:hypothetical protein
VKRRSTRSEKEFGISNVGLSKICRHRQIPVPPRGYWAKKSAGHKMKPPPPLPKPTKPENVEKLYQAELDDIIVVNVLLQGAERVIDFIIRNIDVARVERDRPFGRDQEAGPDRLETEWTTLLRPVR